MTQLDIGTFLKHYGVKGMKWGVTNDYGRGSSGGGYVDKKEVSRRELRKINRANKQAYDLKKVEEAYSEAKTGGEKVLVATKIPGDYAITVVSGKQFVSHVESGGVLDIATTRIFARQLNEGEQYVMNDFNSEVYIPIKRKK